MTTEEQLLDALGAAGAYEPSGDLWSRVIHSIEEDRSHRRRVRLTAAWVAFSIAVAVAIGLLGLERGSTNGRMRIDWRLLEGLEAGALLVVMLAIGPAIRRFGRGFAGDMFTSSPKTGGALLRLLDVAYYLVLTGYILLTTRLEAPMSYFLFDAADQLEDSLARLGGILLVIGSLHALTLMALPLIALVFNSTARGTKLPRWVSAILVVAGLIAGSQLFGLFTLVIHGGTG